LYNLNCTSFSGKESAHLLFSSSYNTGPLSHIHSQSTDARTSPQDLIGHWLSQLWSHSMNGAG